MKPIRKAVIPAAGFGTRFLPFTKAVPKELVPVVDKPVIQYVLEEAAASGITEAAVIVSDGKDAIQARYIVNAAGVFCDAVSALIGDNSVDTTPRKGEYMLFDKTVGHLANHVIFQCPTEMGKGILVTPTVDGNLLIGPSAIDLDHHDKTDVSTTAPMLAHVLETARKSIPCLTTREVITSFAGLRAHCDINDFIIEPSKKNAQFIQVAGIESPGLSSAPAIAVYVKDLIAGQLGAKEKAQFEPGRKEPVRFRHLSQEERKALIAQDPAYGRIICRCEQITEGEILDAIHSPIVPTTIDAIKRRTRAGMGRCQGGFCQPKVLEILARELGKEWTDIHLKDGDSRVLFNENRKSAEDTAGSQEGGAQS